jgi:hypothetical protein
MKDRLLIQETTENLEFQQSLIQTAKKYFNCDASDFYFYDNGTCYLTIYLGVFRVQITVNPKTKYSPKSSMGDVYYGNFTWSNNIKDDSFEDSCRKISEFLKKQVSRIEAGLI